MRVRSVGEVPVLTATSLFGYWLLLLETHQPFGVVEGVAKFWMIQEEWGGEKALCRLLGKGLVPALVSAAARLLLDSSCSRVQGEQVLLQLLSKLSGFLPQGWGDVVPRKHVNAVQNQQLCLCKIWFAALWMLEECAAKSTGCKLLPRPNGALIFCICRLEEHPVPLQRQNNKTKQNKNQTKTRQENQR